MRFADEDSSSDRLPAWTDQIFDAQQPGSLSDYYHEMSGGQFELAGEVVPRWFTARHAASYYVQDEDFAFGTFGDFVVDILDAADRSSTSVDSTTTATAIVRTIHRAWLRVGDGIIMESNREPCTNAL